MNQEDLCRHQLDCIDKIQDSVIQWREKETDILRLKEDQITLIKLTAAETKLVDKNTEMGLVYHVECKGCKKAVELQVVKTWEDWEPKQLL